MNRTRSLERATGAVLVLALLAGCVGQVEREDEVAANAQAVQEPYVVFSDTSTLRWVNLLFQDSMSAVGKSVGVLNVFSLKGFAYNCGVTFISPQFAVTAAHCVSVADVGSAQVTVAQINTTNLNSQALANQLTISGVWPNWTHSSLNSSNGYVTTSYTCTVEVACDTAFRRTANCPTGSTEQVDMALLKCPARKTNSTYGTFWDPVTTTDNGAAQVDTWWFHEVYSLPTQPTGSQYWQHYGRYDGTGTEGSNYHYRFHSYLPLRSRDWDTGTPYKQIGHNTVFETKSDTPVCHGTSGSGVFERGTTLFFGPTLTAGADSSIVSLSRICENMTVKTPGQHLSNHVRATQTVKLENLSMVQNDRP